MFQVAYARALSLANNEDVFIDKSAYKSYKIRSFSVDNLSCIENVKLVEDCDLGYFTKCYLKSTQKVYRIYQKIFKIVTNDLKIGFNSFLCLSKLGLYYNFDPYFYKLENKKNKKKHLYGYFQSELYFKGHEQIIKDEFVVKKQITENEENVLKKIVSCNAVAISMRLGEDYTKLSLLNICNESYYLKAIELAKQKIDKPVFFIFSDRIDIAKEKYNFNIAVDFQIITTETNLFKNMLSPHMPNNSRVKVTYIIGLSGEPLTNHLLENSGLHFSMGTSALERAIHGIPTILMDYSHTHFPKNYLYRWIYEENNNFNLGFLIEPFQIFKGKEMK